MTQESERAYIITGKQLDRLEKYGLNPDVELFVATIRSCPLVKTDGCLYWQTPENRDSPFCQLLEKSIEEHDAQIARARAAPSAWTFTIKPIREIITRYVGDGIGWADPFAGNNSPAEFTNDQHPDRRATSHMDAEEFCKALSGPLNGVIFDPPYSYRQVSEHYKSIGMKARSIDTSANYYNRVMNAICDKVRPGGYAISCGWNSNAFGPNRGFAIVEILLVAHGQHHNDTIVTVERKVPA